MSFLVDTLRTYFYKNKIKHLSPQRQMVVKMIGYIPKRWDLFKLAFTLKSTNDVQIKGMHVNNERLEYLGDAVLEAIVSDYLYHKYPSRNEGYLTESRSSIVKRITLNSIGQKMGMDDLIISKEAIPSDNIYGNIFEALVGAIYLDRGYEYSKQRVIYLIETYLKVDRFLFKEENYKSLMIEFCQKQHWTYQFDLIEEIRVNNNLMRFQTQVYVEGVKCGLGVGKSKRESEQKAAKHTLPTLKKMATSKVTVSQS